MMFPHSEAGVTATEKTTRPGATLRALLARPAILDQPYVCDPLAARLAAEAGYQAVALSAAAMGAHLPLTSSLGLDDIERAAAAVVRACRVPVLLEADIGWGETGGLPAAVTRLETAGVAAIAVASQHLPDQVPFSEAAERGRACSELLGRVRAARAARTCLLVAARCAVAPGASASTEGYADALGQAVGLLEAGADAILLHAPAALLPRFPRDLPGAALIYSGSPSGPPAGAGELQGWGYRGLSLQYHRCYCARMRLSAPSPGRPASVSPGQVRSPGYTQGTGAVPRRRAAETCPQGSEHREDLERKQ